MFQFQFEALIGAQHFRGASARNDRFDHASVTRAAGHVVNQLAHCDRADFDFEIAGPLHVAAHANYARAGIIRPAKPRVRAAAHRDDVLHVTERLNVVHDRRAHVEAEDRGKIRRLDPRIGALAFERFDQAGFFAADVGARAAMDVNFHIEAGAEHVLPDEIMRARFFDRALENLRALGKLAADVDVGRLRVQRETGDQDSLEELMRIFVNDVAILERARLGFVGVANQVDRFFFVRLDETPFHPARKTGATASAQSRGLHFVDDLRT